MRTHSIDWLRQLGVSLLFAGLGAQAIANTPGLPGPLLMLPEPALASAQGPAQTEVTVVEPHLSRPGHAPVQVRYRGWPAHAILKHWLGPGWDQGGQELEFRALDGFVSRIPVERFHRHQAWIVTARADGRPFQVDNHAQGEKQVPLGPYYLIWDNLSEPALQAEGGAVWPYQVAAIRLTASSDAALLPGNMRQQYFLQARTLQTHCLSCHQVNGYGGDKMPLNLASSARSIDAARWQQWLLQPARVKPGTRMPPLSEGLPQVEREALARQLQDYLKALPLQP